MHHEWINSDRSGKGGTGSRRKLTPCTKTNQDPCTSTATSRLRPTPTLPWETLAEIKPVPTPTDTPTKHIPFNFGPEVEEAP